MGETQITAKTINVQKAMESRDLFLVIGALSGSVISPIIVFAIVFIKYRLDIAGRRIFLKMPAELLDDP